MLLLDILPPSTRWTPTSLRRGDVLAFAGHDRAVYAVSHTRGRNVVYRSDDGGAQWAAVSVGLASELCVTAIHAHPSGLFAGTLAHGIYRTTDDGRTWQPVNAGLPDGASIYALTARGTVLFAGTENAGVFRSINDGDRWTAVNAGLPLEGRNLTALALATTPTHLFVSHPFGLHRSADDGDRWEAVNTGLPPGLLVLSLHAGPHGSLYASNPNRLFRSLDAGDTWMTLSGPFGDGGLIRALAHGHDALFLGLQGIPDGGVFFTRDRGASWRPLTDGLPHLSWSLTLAAIDGYLLAGVGGRGVFRRSLADFGAQPDPPPRLFSLDQNEPNPFDSATTISCRLWRDAHVLLDILDSSGRTVHTLVDGPMKAGTHHLRFHAGPLPAGFYSYRLHVGSMSQTRQMLLLK